MSWYSVKYDNEIETETLEDIKRSYNFVIDAVHNMDPSITVNSVEFQINIGDIFAVIDDYNEFINAAYGHKIELHQVSIWFYYDEQRYAGVSIYCKSSLCSQNISVMSSNSVVLDKITSAFDIQKKQIQQQVQTNVTNIYQGDHIEIQNDAHIESSNIGGNNNQTIVYHDSPVPKERTSFLKSLWINIVSNWIWWIIGCLLTVLLIGLGLNK